MATGRGKSLIFHVHAARSALLRNKASVFVYPLRALVSDQAFHLGQVFDRLGMVTRVLTGETPLDDRDEVFADLARGGVDIVLTTPEFLAIHSRRFAEGGRVGFVVVDEAHHAGQAQGGSRPAYLDMPRIRAELGNPTVLAVTATASDPVASEVCRLLDIGESGVVLDPSCRENLHVIDERNSMGRDDRLVSLLASGEKSLVYVNSRETTVSLARMLRRRVWEYGHRVAFYNGGLRRADRAAVEEAFRSGELRMVISTSAFGEGVNLPDVRHVVLYHLPFDEVEFNQMSGRAGRDGVLSLIHLAYGANDARINERILALDAPPRDDLVTLYRVLSARDRQARLGGDGGFTATNAELAGDCVALHSGCALNDKGVSCGIDHLPRARVRRGERLRGRQACSPRTVSGAYGPHAVDPLPRGNEGVGGVLPLQGLGPHVICPRRAGADRTGPLCRPSKDRQEPTMAEEQKNAATAVENLPEAPLEEGQDNFAILEEAARSYLPPEDVERVKEAYRFALSHHRGQKRKSGEPYINHPVEVAIILAQNLHSDADTLCAGLLHDTVEDTDATFEQIERLFGKQVAELVDGVTKLTNISVSSLSEQQALNLRKMFLAMAKDIRVIIIKLADRLHNMRTLMAIPEDRRIFKAHETMEIYAPLANRLGISSIKWELEDLSFFYLEPAKYRQIMRMVAESRDERERYLEEVIGVMRTELDRAGIENYRIMGRPKHLYSIYMKMKNKGKDFSDIYDLIALRVITEDVRDCYGVLGAVHSLWTPMPGRFKDYIAMPKFNMYQSLHTTVIGPAGRPLEIQIRTEEMHQHAEYGIAAHWLYKQAGNSEGNKASDAQRLDNQLAWLGRTLDWTQQDDLSDPQEFLEALKIDLFESEVFVFTPKGEVQILRAGSTPLDFAYAVHTEVGNHCIGAKVNGSVVPLSYELQMGDRVEVLTQNNAKPSRDWLNIVRTPSARAKIRSYFSKIAKADDSVQGRGDPCPRDAQDRPGHLDAAHGARPGQGGPRPGLCHGGGPLCRHQQQQVVAPYDRRQGQGDSRRGHRHPGGGREARPSEPHYQRHHGTPAHLALGPERRRAQEAQHRHQRCAHRGGRQLHARPSRPLLQPGHGRRHRGLYHPGPWRERPPGGLSQRGGAAQVGGAHDRGRVGHRPDTALPGGDRGRGRGPHASVG